MGCSPSRGNNFNGTQGSFRRGRTLLPGSKENPTDSQSDDGGSGCSGGVKTDREVCETTAGEKRLNTCSDTSLGKKHPVSEQATISHPLTDTQEITINLLSKEKQLEKEDERKDDKKGSKKSKKSNKSGKASKKKEKDKKYSVEEKVDFPEPLVKAHQAAYGFLNPSIAKYEILLGLLDHAAQTQISLQPMVAFMALRYEEINHALEEMVKQGEKLVKESGEHLAWPCSTKYPPSSASAKNRPASTELPPDLLQQLLQYTVQRMRIVGQSVSGIGNTSLEDAVDYFSTVCEILEEKLKTKRAAEAKLMQLLTRIEAASLRRPGPEDSALFSEDSGIGAESESLAGSDRQRHRRESCESTGSSRTTVCSSGGSTPVHLGPKRRLSKKMSNSGSLNSMDSVCTITGKDFKDTESLLGSVSLDDGDRAEEEEENEGSEEEQYEGKIRKLSSSSSTGPSNQPTRLPAKRIENPQNVEMTLKMKDAISGRIHFLPSQPSAGKIKTGVSKSSERQWTEEGEKSPKRPQTPQMQKKKTTVSKHCRSRSAESIRSKTEDPTLLELERTQKELSQRLERMRKVRFEGNIKKDISKQIQGLQTNNATPTVSGPVRPLNKHLTPANSQKRGGNTKAATGKQEDRKEKEEEKKKIEKTTKGPLKATPPPSPPISPRQSVGTGRAGNSVKKLIDTFSQGMEESKLIHENKKVLGPLKGVRKCGVLVLPGLGSAGTFTHGENYQEESKTLDRLEDLDFDNLPPPPLEVLMDNSFENVEESKTDEIVNKRGRSTLPKRTSMTQRLRASMQSVTVLPSKGSVQKSSLSMSPARTVPPEPIGMAKICNFPVSKPEPDLENEEAASLYKQARKIIHLRHSGTDSPGQKATAEQSNINPCAAESNVTRKEEDKATPETVPSTPTAGSHPPTTPPVSRTRMLPSTPILHRRLPSPPVLKKQPLPSGSSSPPVFRTLPTPPSAGQRTLPTTPTVQQGVTLTSFSGVSYPIKAPSPPASPKVQRWSRENSNEDLNSRVFSNARSVFCPASPSLFEAQPFPLPKPPQAWTSSGGSILPRPWGERGRTAGSVRGPQAFIRRSQSDRRPSLNAPPRAPSISIAQTCGSEPAISSQGLEDGPTGEVKAWNEQTELRGSSRSSSHPDLCIVGQSLQRE